MSDEHTHIENGYLVDTVRSLVLRLDSRGIILYLNAFTEEYFGYPKGYLILKSIFGTILDDTEEERNRIRGLVEQIRTRPESPLFMQVETKKADNSSAWLSISVSPYFQCDELIEIFCVGNDISESKKYEIELRETNDRFKVMLENVQTGVIIIDPEESVILYANNEALRIIGIDRDSVIGERCDKWCGAMSRLCASGMENENGAQHHIETIIDRSDGTRVHIFMSSARIMFGETPYVLANFIDISEHKLTEEKLIKASRHIEELLSSIVSVLIGVSIDDYVTHWNRAAEEAFGIGEGEVLGKRFPLCPIDWDWKRMYEGIANSVITNKVIKIQGLRFVKTDRSEGYLDVTINPMLDKSKNVTGYIIFGEDVTERQINKLLIEEIERRKKAEEDLKKANEELERLATHDPLTDLHNRRSLMANLETEFQRAKRYKTPLALLVMDIDYFKKINDTHGHVIGDRVLVAVAQTLNQVTRSTDITGRYGGEEFCVVLPLTDAERAMITSEKIRRAIMKNKFTGNGSFGISCSIGISEITDSDNEMLSLVRRADEGLYEAKNGGRNRSVIKMQNP